MLWKISEFVILLGLLTTFLITFEAGFRLGRSHLDRNHDPGKSHISSLQGAILGLLALLLGFTISMAVDRFNLRKALVLEEANAIGTTYLRTQFLPPLQSKEAADLLAAYVAARLDFSNAGIDDSALAAANTAASNLESQLWVLAVAAAAQDPRSVPIGLFIQSLNDVIDNHEKRQAAVNNHVPETVIFLLIGFSVVALGFIGYGCGLSKRRQWIANTTFVLLITLVLTAILDIDRPSRGFIRVNQGSLLRLKTSLGQAAPNNLKEKPIIRALDR